MYDISYIKDQIQNTSVHLGRDQQVSVVLNALKKIESYTAFHSYRVGNIAGLIAQALHFEVSFTEKVIAAGMLHDIGKSGIDIDTLLKPSRLSNSEYLEIKKHPQLGAELVQLSPSLNDLVPGILYHHERFDGQGYPLGLQGTDIPIEARIIAIADTYDAITSTRVYRVARSHQEALLEIQAGSGTQFDPEIVEATFNCELETKLSELNQLL